ncbi:MAG: hypothetical protein NT049_02915 [Planctomycetota bacterium]|nr:hypothetical protein [Planctomycetota bacterium]
MAALPTLSGVFGGKVEFAEKAFPIVAEAKDVGVQNAIRATKLLPCQVCKGTGKVNKRELIKPGPAVRGTAIWQTWEEDCQACGGFKDVYDPRFGQRLLEVVDRLGHVLRDAKFDELRKEAEGRLVEAVDVRDKTITTLRCKPTIRTEQRMETDSYGNISTHTIQTLTGATTEPDQQKPFHVDVAPLVEPLWMRVGPQAPIGQAVIIIGTTSDKTEAAGWVWMRLKPLGKGPEAILLCGTLQANVAPAGKVVFGGLMVGRWIPEGGAEAPQPVAPVAGAKGPPPSTVGLLPKGTLPVILAVVAAEGK